MTPLAWIHVAALVGSLGWLASLVLPASRAVRVRNAFLLRRGLPDDFDWTPDAPPGRFRIENKPAPAAIAEAVRASGALEAKDDWSRALRLVGMLVQHARDTGPVRADLAATLRGIVAGRGYCSDFVRVYLAAAREAGLFCRQWAFAFDGRGHTFVEVYDRDHSRWAFIDVHNNVFAVRTGNTTPLSAGEVRDALLADPGSLEFPRAAPGRLGFPEPRRLLDYYVRGAREWYLWFGNDVVSRDGPLRPWGHRARTALGLLPAMVAVPTPANDEALQRLAVLKRKVRRAFLLTFVLAVTLPVQLVVSAPGGRLG